MRLPISVSHPLLLWRLVVIGSVSALFLGSMACPTVSAAPKWSRPAAARRVPSRQGHELVVNYQREAVFHDPAVVAAVWEEDDGFVARTQTVVERGEAHRGEDRRREDRSVVVRRSTAGELPPRDRLAQLPKDPFEEAPTGLTPAEPATEFGIEEPTIEEVEIEEAESAIEEEFDRRESEQDLSDQDLFGDSPAESLPAEEEFPAAEPEAAEVDPFDEPQVSQLTEPRSDDSLVNEFDEAEGSMESPSLEPPPAETFESERDLFDKSFGNQQPGNSDELSDLFEAEMKKDEADGTALPEAEAEEPIELGSPLSGESQDEKSAEREEAARNCADEVDKVRSERIDDIDLSIVLEGDAGEDFPFECQLDAGHVEPRQWPQITYNWKAAALSHKPLYFEQVHLERYGHSWGPYVQPIMSGVHFFGTIPILPYKMGIRTPTESVYTLGYYRPGSCAPYLIDPIPFTWRAALFQGGFSTAMPFIFP